MRTRRITERAMRKMQVPAYWPLFAGVQVVEKRGVLVEVKNVIAMVDMDMDMDIGEDMPDMEEPVEVAMAMDVVMDMDMDMGMGIVDVDVATDMDVVISFISIVTDGEASDPRWKRTLHANTLSIDPAVDRDQCPTDERRGLTSAGSPSRYRIK